MSAGVARRLSSDESLRSVAWAATIAAAFILSRPYDGIKHDAVLYLAQALSRLHPEIFRGDVFFRFGSQDQYTLFTPAYTWLIGHFGLTGTNISLVLLFQALFLASSFALVRALLPDGIRGFAMLFLASGLGIYGAGLVFRIAEPFVTPRPLVEALTLIAIALLASGKRYWSVAILAVGAALHPLVSIAGLVYWWIFQTLLDRRWAWLAMFGLVLAAIGLAGIAPFSQLFQRFDDAWLVVLLENNYNLFVSRWTMQDWSFLAFDLFTLAVGLHFAEGKLRLALQAALGTAALGVGAAFIGADLLQDVLLADVQTWRVLWLTHWMSAMTLPLILRELWRDGPVCRLVAGLLVYGFFTRGLPTSLASVLLAWLAFHFRTRLAVRESIVHVVTIALLGGAYANWFNSTSRVHDSAFFDSLSPISDFVVQSLSKPFVLAVGGIAMAWFVIRRCQSVVAALVAGCMLVVACTVWDQRTPYKRYVESAEIGSHPFSQHVAPDEEVLWHGDLIAPWVMMLRRSYFSVAQQSGQMFNRDTAINLEKRGKVLALLDLQETVCSVLNNLNRSHDSCEPDLQVIQEVCRDAPELSHVVLTTRIEGKWAESWTPPVDTGGRAPHYYLYDCATLVRD